MLAAHAGGGSCSARRAVLVPDLGRRRAYDVCAAAVRVRVTMPGAGAAHVHDPRATGTERLEILLEEVLQGQDRVLQEQRAMAERLARLEAKLDDLKAKNKGGAIEKFDWFAFAVEVARYERMDCDDGIPSRDE